MPSRTILQPRWLIPVEGRVVLTDHALVIEGSNIAAILPAVDAAVRYPGADIVMLPEHALLPGLINLHAHSAMTLLRGYADDLGLMTWLSEHIWPAENKHVSDAFVFDGTQLAIAEMIRGGISCANDMYFHHGAVARAALASGFRIMVGCSILDFPTPYAANADAYIQKALACIDEFKGESLVGFTLAPHAPYTVGDDTFSRTIMLADELGIGIHCHIHETQDEIANSLKQYGVRPLERLANLGLLSGQLVAAHMVHMTDAEITLIANRGTHIAHNPASNLKLASGFARVADQLAAGINVGIGTDGAASNNKLDMFAELRLTALLAKGQSNDPQALPAWQALEMATIAGARALGWDKRIGSLSVGKAADVIAVDLSALGTQPCFDPVSQLVYACDRNQVSHVWIDGQLRLADGELTGFKLAALQNTVQRWRERIVRDRMV